MAAELRISDDLALPVDLVDGWRVSTEFFEAIS